MTQWYTAKSLNQLLFYNYDAKKQINVQWQPPTSMRKFPLAKQVICSCHECACALSLIGFACYVISFKVRCTISCFSDFLCLIIEVSWRKYQSLDGMGWDVNHSRSSLPVCYIYVHLFEVHFNTFRSLLLIIGWRYCINTTWTTRTQHEEFHHAVTLNDDVWN